MDTLTLKPNNLIARGWHRECYLHPEDENLCIKIVVNGDDVETQREQSYYKLLEERLPDWHALPRFHGNVSTNLGNGAVFDLIRDHDGKVSKTFADYLDDEHKFRAKAKDLLIAMINLMKFQLEYNVQTMSLKPTNLLFQIQADGYGVLHIVDNLGNSDWIPLCNYSHFFGNKKICRKWMKFIIKMEEQYADRSDILKMLNSFKQTLKKYPRFAKRFPSHANVRNTPGK